MHWLAVSGTSEDERDHDADEDDRGHQGGEEGPVRVDDRDVIVLRVVRGWGLSSFYRHGSSAALSKCADECHHVEHGGVVEQ